VTLISLMVGLVVGLLVLSATLQAYMLISEGARDTLRQARLDQELRAALDVMRIDIRRAGYWDPPDLDGQGDPDPLDNPFQRRYGTIDNDLCVDNDDGDCAAPVCTTSYDSGECRAWVQTGSCLTYGYDSDGDGRIGLRACAAGVGESECPRPSGAPFEAADQEPYAWRAWYPPDAATPTKPSRWRCRVPLAPGRDRHARRAPERRGPELRLQHRELGAHHQPGHRDHGVDLQRHDPGRQRPSGPVAGCPVRTRRSLPLGALGRHRDQRPARWRGRQPSANSSRAWRCATTGSSGHPDPRSTADSAMPRNPAQIHRRQDGSMTLLFGLMLLIGAGILAFSSARTGVVEQRIATNEQQSILAQQAAQAGLDYALAWLGTQVWRPGDAVPSVPDLSAEDGQRFRIELQFSRRTNAVCVRSRASSDQDPGLESIARECFTQTGLFDVAPETRAPPPLVLAGCLEEPLEPSELWRLDEDAPAILSGNAADADCLPQGQLAVGVWNDRNADRVLTPDEKGRVPIWSARGSTVVQARTASGTRSSPCRWTRPSAAPRRPGMSSRTGFPVAPPSRLDSI
jgi:hypothetical protein